MPIYEYQCQACDHRLEALQKMSDAPLSDCPECGAAQLTKLISAGSFKVKGGGAQAGGCPAAEGIPPCATGGGCPGAG